MFFDINSDGKIDKNEFKNFLDDLQLTADSSLGNVFGLETRQWINHFEKLYSEKYSSMIKDEMILDQKKNYLTCQWENLYLKCFPDRDSYKVLSHSLLREMLISICLVLCFQEKKIRVSKDFPNFNLISTRKLSIKKEPDLKSGHQLDIQKFFLKNKINDILDDVQDLTVNNDPVISNDKELKKCVVKEKPSSSFNYNNFLISKFLYKKNDTQQIRDINKKQQRKEAKPVQISTSNHNKENNCSNLSERIKTNIPFFKSKQTEIAIPKKKILWDNSKKQTNQIKLKGLKSFMK